MAGATVEGGGTSSKGHKKLALPFRAFSCDGCGKRHGSWSVVPAFSKKASVFPECLPTLSVCAHALAPSALTDVEHVLLIHSERHKYKQQAAIPFSVDTG